MKQLLIILTVLALNHSVALAITSSSVQNRLEQETPGAAKQRVMTFYGQIHDASGLPICAGNATGLTAITNCVVYVINQLKPLAAVLLVIAITASGAYLVFSPLSPSGVETAKTIFIWACIGFVIVFSADLIRGVLHELAGVRQ